MILGPAEFLICPVSSRHAQECRTRFGRIDCGTDLGQNGPCRNCNLSSETEGHAHSYINTNYVERDPLCAPRCGLLLYCFIAAVTPYLRVTS